jgi:hypothetical protein
VASVRFARPVRKGVFDSIGIVPEFVAIGSVEFDFLAEVTDSAQSANFAGLADLS